MNENIENLPLDTSMEKAYIDYSMSVIVGRALPDARDGLKPVHRRILYAMKDLNITSRTPFKKSARIVGETIGKYHPHGDCLSPSTEVYLVGGETKTIKELYDENKDVEILTYDTKTEAIRHGVAHSFRIGQYADKTYTIHLSNGATIEATGNHPFYFNGEWVKTEDLKINMVTISFDRTTLKKTPLYITDVIVNKVDEKPMYDFTVDDTENMLICVDNEIIITHNSAVYDAMVRMAQNFSMKIPLVDGQGNFGSVDGDNQASSRYTEARMTKMGEQMLTDLEKDTVDFNPTYDDSLIEPEVLPARIPNLLLNGTSGIAVGMTTDIPSHNLNELMGALLLLIDNPNCDDNEIFNIIKGPDFPTGGTIYGKKGILDAYKTGKGKIKLRAKTHIEERKNRTYIIIDEIPYKVNKSKLIEHIVDLIRNKVIEDIAEIRDESDRDGMRVVIKLKKDSISDIVLNNLYKHTNLEISFSIKMLAIDNKEPKIFNLRGLLELFLRHRKSVVIRRTLFDLNKAKKRVEILEGLLKAVVNIDKVISIIKSSKDTNVAKEKLIIEFNLNQNQVNAILEMKLKRLTGLEKDKIENELLELNKLITYLNSILRNEDVLNNIIREEFVEIMNTFKDKRKTDIVNDYNSIDIEDLIPNEQMVVTITHNGYIKRVSLKQYDKQNRGGKGKIAVTTHSDDFIEKFFIGNTHDTLMFVTDKGQLYWLRVFRIPEGGRVAKGKAVVNLLNLKPNEKIVSIIPTVDFSSDKSLIFFTKNGLVKRTNLKEYSNIRSNGVRAINLDTTDSIVTAKIANPDTKWLFITTKKGQSVRFNIDNVREIGRIARGVIGIKFKKENDFVCGATTINDENNELLIISEKGIGKRTTITQYSETARGGTGVIGMKLNLKTGNVVGVLMVEEDKDVMCLTSDGKMIRVDMQTIRRAGRNTSGVKIINVDKSDKVVSIAKCQKEDLDIENIDINK